MSDNESVTWLKERINDKKHFTARYAAQLAEASGSQPETVAKVAVGVVFLVLALSDQAHFFGNFILIAVPALLIFAYPQEKPTDQSLHVYFTAFGVLTIFDRSLEKIPLYYVLKLALFLLLYIPPYRFVDDLEEFIKKQLQDEDQKNTQKSQRSARSTPQQNTTKTAISTTGPASSQRGQQLSKRGTSPAPAASIASTAVLGPKGGSGAATEQPEPENRLIPAVSGTDLLAGSQRLKVGQNPMQVGSFHNLRSDDGFNGRVIGPENNLNDIFFFPTNKLIFNAPFDFENLTYHMKIVNNSHHRIAYAIKGNSVPRVMAYPAFGILKLKESRYIAVTVQKFDWNPVDFEKDRIAFDYVILPDDNKEQTFDLRMMQNSESRRRKNIIVGYNP